MPRESVDEIPLLEEGFEEEDFKGSEHSSGQSNSARSGQRPTRSRRRIYEILAFALSVSVNLLVVSSYVLRRWSGVYYVKWRGVEPAWSPAQDAEEHVRVRFSSLAEITPYHGPPTDEVDQAWDDLFTDGIVSSIPKSEAANMPSRTLPWPGDEDHYVVALDVFHQLHCLNVLRKYAFPERFPIPDPYRYQTLADGTALDHTDHCINSIRQVIMCKASITPLPYPWNPLRKKIQPKFDNVHTCTDFGALQAWARQNAGRGPFNASVLVHDDLAFPDGS